MMSMNLVANFNLLFQIEEEETFELLCHLMYDLGLRKLYKPNMAGLQVSMYQLARLMRYVNIFCSFVWIEKLSYLYKSLFLEPLLITQHCQGNKLVNSIIR